MERTEQVRQIIEQAITTGISLRKEYVTPEMLLLAFATQPEASKLFTSYRNSLASFIAELHAEVAELYTLDEEAAEGTIELSMQAIDVITRSEIIAHSAGKDSVDVPHMLAAIIGLDESQARYILLTHTTTDTAELLSTIVTLYRDGDIPLHDAPADDADDPYDADDWGVGDTDGDATTGEAAEGSAWRRYVTCINDQVASHNPLIGREAELERTMQVLCRMEKNNPLHVGHPGVGKTSLVYGLAARIEAGDVPERLRGRHIYQMDVGTLIAGTSYRGDFEKRIKAIIEGVGQEPGAIIYIDEIHTLIGSGAVGEGALDGANLLKPYLERGDIRFIGSTTYQEYSRYVQSHKGIVRRFQQIDIAEPTVDETVSIIEGLLSRYEAFHGVTYADGVVRHAVEAAARYVGDRYLPDKAIDLIDEAGASCQMHPTGEAGAPQVVTRAIVDDVLARVCKVDPRAMQADDTMQLETLAERMKAQIFGQDEAIRQVVEAVQMGKAGLIDEGKPISSLLFVGPTGVGKTEVCKVLAQELGIELVRFDMSEYTERHTVAKLIGAPAGYVGYDDGGLLTDAIRRTPHCVLLLDEIEKAHSDIYNILLQVMDYARLTDNKGQQADFRHVVLIMTSNAGAQYARQAQVGFASSVTTGQAMLSAVGKTFKPEFMARLSATVVFHDMDSGMAGRILDKKLAQLSTRLAARGVAMTLTPEARALLLARGFSPRNGAREMDRQIAALLTPLFTREILFGRLKSGGEATVDVREGVLAIV